MLWRLSWRADPLAREIADRHYNRQKIGAAQFVPPGSCLVLMAHDNRALWVTSVPLAEYVQHEWAGAWMCSCFRREGGAPASDLMWDALKATRAYYGDPPPLGMVTFIDESQVRPTKVRGRLVYGWTWLRRGWRVVGRTKGGLLALGISPEDMPEPFPAIGSQLELMP